MLGLCKWVIPNESKLSAAIHSLLSFSDSHSFSLLLCFISASISVSILPLYLVQQNATNGSHETIGYAVLTPEIFLVRVRGGKGQA